MGKRRQVAESETAVAAIYEELATQITDGDRYYMPRLLQRMISVEEARIARELPATPSEVARALDLPEEAVVKALKTLVRKGVCTKAGEGRLRMFWTVVQYGDYAMATPEFDKERGEEFFDLQWGVRTSDEFLTKYRESLSQEARPAFRVLPRWKAIRGIPGVMPCEDLREILRAFDGRMSSVRCICRLTMSARFCAIHEGTRPEEGHCIKFGSVADHYVKEMGIGSYLSWQQAIALLDDTEKSPVYHMIGNSRDVRGGFCNCCACCCDVRMGLTTAGSTAPVSTVIAPSRFVCRARSEKCTGCGICLGKCPFGAIVSSTVGRKADVDSAACMGCGTCVLNCPAGALSLRLVRPVEHISETGPQHIEESLGY